LCDLGMLDQVNQGYADIEAGRVLRGAMTF
jgi:hypothetical protein